MQSMVFLLVQPVSRATRERVCGSARPWQWTSRRFISPRLTLPATITYVIFSPAAADAKLRARCIGGAEWQFPRPSKSFVSVSSSLILVAGQLSRQGANLRLPQQPMQLFAILLERPGEILTREELRQRLWASDVFVDFDHGLNKSIQKIRDALGDSAASPRYIETIPRVGYRFIAPVAAATSRPRSSSNTQPQPPQPPPQRQAGLPAALVDARPGRRAVSALAGLYFSWRPHRLRSLVHQANRLY